MSDVAFLERRYDFHVDTIKCTLHQVLRLPNYILSLDFYFYNNCDITFLTVFILTDLTDPVNFPCGRKPERPEKTHDFRQSVDRLFSHESVARDQTHELRGAKRASSSDYTPP